MGGVHIDVSGSGTAKGSGNAVAGAQAQASAGFAYSGGKTWTPVQSFASWTNPSVKMKFSTVTAVSATVMVTGRLQGQIVLGSGVGTLTGHIDLTAQAVIDYKTSSTTKLSASIAAAQDRRALGATAAAAAAASGMDGEEQTFAPGSDVPIDVSYSGLVPEEEHTLFFSLVTPEGQDIPIHEGRFVSSKSGKGTHRSAWRVPSDSRFAEKAGHKIRVRCSNLYSRTVSTQPFSISSSSSSSAAAVSAPSSVVSEPADGDRVVTGDERPFLVRWDTSNMHRFKRDGPMHGKRIKTSRVVFELHGEKLDKTGAVVTQGSTRRLVQEPVANTGEASVVIPPSFAASFDRFYVEVHDADADEVGGSSSGYFYHRASPASASVARPGAARVPRVADRRGRGDGKAMRLRGGGAETAAVGVVHDEQETSSRALANCASKFYFGYGVMASGGLDSMKILLWNVPIGQDLPYQWLLPLKVTCV